MEQIAAIPTNGQANPPGGGSLFTRHRLLSGRTLLRLTVLVTYLFIFAPVISVILLSFFSSELVTFPPQDLTLKWYVNVWNRREFVYGIVTSAQIAFAATLIGVPLGTAAALGIHRSKIRWKPVFNALLLGPLVMPGVVAGAMLYMGYFQVGNFLGVSINGTLTGLVAAHVLLTIPWTVRLVVASLQGMDGTQEEAAADLGAHPWTIFGRITLPALRPGIVAAFLFSLIASFENLEISMFLVGPGRSTLPVVMLNYLEYRIDPTIAAAATVQIVLIGVLMLITDRYVKLSKVI